jgi:predicted Rdx family selenoprotein
VSAAHDLLRDYQHVIAELRLVTGSKGIFDVIVDDEVLYSKHSTGRHAKPGEILELFRTRYGQGVEVYEH